MTDNAYFLCTTGLTGLVELKVGGESALQAFSLHQEAIRAACGRDAAELFAQPVITRGNGATNPAVAWYSAIDGTPARLDELDPGSRAQAEARLRERLLAVAVRLTDPDLAALVAPRLHIASASNIWMVDGTPVLTNWGVLPADIADSPAKRDEHFRRALGRYLPNMPAPPLDPEAQARLSRPTVAPVAEPASAAPIAAAAVPVPPAPAPLPEPVYLVQESWYRRPWVPVLAAVIVATLTLLFLLLPGVLLYPEPTIAAQVDPASGDVGLRREINATLQERVDTLRRAVAENSCTAQGDLILPGGLTPRGIAPDALAPGPRVGGPGSTPAGPVPGGPRPLVPPSPQALTVPPAGPGMESHRLVDLLDRTTALVIAIAADPDQSGIGSAFFVTPRLLVTNMHVVENAKPQGIKVTSPALGGLLNATVVYHTANGDAGSEDFAVLEVEAPPDQPFLQLATKIDRLDSVIAAGFPGILMNTDADFQRLTGGDPTGIPQMAVTQGFVTAVQRGSTPIPVIAHTAAISGGNSGGPLVDSCGRVVGVNTYGRTDKTAHRMNYSLHSEGLGAFLERSGVAFLTTADACQPMIAQAVPPAPADPPSDPGAPPPPAANSPPTPEPPPASADPAPSGGTGRTP